MRLSLHLSALVATHAVLAAALPTASNTEKRDTSGPQFENGQPIDGKGKGGRILGNRPPTSLSLMSNIGTITSY